MYPSEYSQSTDFGGQRSASSARRNEYAPPPQNYGFSSSSLFTPGDPGGFVMPSAGPHLHQQPGGNCGPSPLGFINPNEHVGHHHGHHPPVHQQQWQQQPPSGPGGFVYPGGNYPAPSIFPPVPQPQQQMTAYPPAPQPMYRQQQHAHGAENNGYPQRKSVHFLPPYSERDPHSEVSTAVGYPDRNKRRDSVLSQSRPESVASRHSAASSLHTLVPNSPSAQMYATPSQVGMSVYNKHGGNLHPSSSPPRRHDMQNSRQAAYTWENLRYNN
ncbi:hypothetical protein GGH91_004712 [Coemansia sp. RSA 2671]|nr:hypothetical protein LPJ60_003154 [Coemansia sp. RSA 2675]KAJ2338765.1 hypothetical protein GGH91_004712 [Coemansia sp. RSA 2671]